MSKTLLGKMLFQKRWWMFWWFIAAAGTAASTVAFYPAFKGSNISKVFNSLPSSVQHFTGTGTSFNSITGYVSNEVFTLRAPIIIIILSIIVFNNLTVSEERRGILESQISLPLSRMKILFSKLIAGIVVVFVASGGLFAGVELALKLINYSYPTVNLIELVLSTAVLAVIFGLVVVMLNAIFGIRSIVLGLSCAFAFISYMLTSFVSSVHNLKFIEKASPFHYYSTTGSFSFHTLSTLIYIGLGLIVISFIFFAKRDIET
jgi:putative exporter of polyketide antibiotics